MSHNYFSKLSEIIRIITNLNLLETLKLELSIYQNCFPMPENEYTFEVLVIDKNGQTNITKESSLQNALSYSEKLWKNIKLEGTSKIVDADQEIELKIHAIGTQSTPLTDLIDAGFVLRVKGKNFEAIEDFRHPLLIHLRKNLSFTNIRILRDDISTRISNDIYPLINQVENLLRRYLVLFFTQRIGVDWWGTTAPGTLTDKINLRKNNEKVFTSLCDTDVTLIDFDDLGELIYKQTSGFNRQENIITRIMATASIEDLDNLKEELQGNYTKYFKEVFQDNNFDKKWKTLLEIRNKVAHNNLFVLNDFKTAEQLVSELTKIINEAESKIETFKFSLQEQEAILQATIEAVKIAEQQTEPTEKNVEKWGYRQLDIKILGKIDLPEESEEEEEDDDEDNYNDRHPFRIITEKELLSELEFAEKNARRKNLSYVGLKIFVTRLLGARGYAFGPSYSIINILRDKGLIEIYEVIDENSFFQPKAIRIKD